MVRTVTPSQLDVIVSFTFERQAKLVSVEEFKRRLTTIPQVRHCAELEGPSDFLIEAELPNLAAYHDLVATVIDPARRLISRFETNFVSRHFVCDDDGSRQVWAHANGGMRRIDLDRAQWIASEGDYVRVSVDGDTVLIHATLNSVAQRLAGLPFLQIHRSTLVNLLALRRVRHEGRQWFVELVDGSNHRIAKGRISEVNRHLADRSEHRPAISSMAAPLNGPVRPIDRKFAAPPLLT